MLRFQSSRRLLLVLFICAVTAGLTGCSNQDEMFFGGGQVLSVELNVDDANFTGTCPHVFNFTGLLTTNGSGRIAYVWERSTGNSELLFVNLPLAGQLAILDALSVESSGSVTVTLHITEPNDISSNSLTVTANCQ